jgi:hypothetical protein
MLRRVFAGVFLFSVVIVAGKAAQLLRPGGGKPVWTMEFIKVRPGMFGLTLGYFDDNWMRVCEEAKHQGALLSYHRIVEQGGREGDGTIVLLTEYKDPVTFYGREKLFASIREHLLKTTSGVLRPSQQGDLYETISTRIFQDYSDTTDPKFQLLGKE